MRSEVDFKKRINVIKGMDVWAFEVLTTGACLKESLLALTGDEEKVKRLPFSFEDGKKITNNIRTSTNVSFFIPLLDKRGKFVVKRVFSSGGKIRKKKFSWDSQIHFLKKQRTFLIIKIEQTPRELLRKAEKKPEATVVDGVALPPPSVPEGFVVEEHIPVGDFKWNNDEVGFFLGNQQEECGYQRGINLLKEIRNKKVRVLDLSVGEFLLKNPSKLSLLGKYEVIFWGTIMLRREDGALLVGVIPERREGEPIKLAWRNLKGFFCRDEINIKLKG